MGSGKTRPCERCGRLVAASQRKRHTSACKELPPPAELLKIWRDNPDYRLSTLEDLYNVSISFVRGHLYLAGVTKEEMKERQYTNGDRGPRGATDLRKSECGTCAKCDAPLSTCSVWVDASGPICDECWTGSRPRTYRELEGDYDGQTNWNIE